MTKANGSHHALANGAETSPQARTSPPKARKARNPSKPADAAHKPAKARQTPIGDNITASVESGYIVLRVKADQKAIDAAGFSQSGKVKLLARSNGWQGIDLGNGQKPVSLQMVITYRP